MSKSFKIAFLRARTNPTAVISDQACREMLLIGPRSLLRYWSDCTDGYLDFADSAMFPWVDVTFGPADIDFNNNVVSRNVQVAKAYAATKALPNGHLLDNYDGIAVITSPGSAFNATNTMVSPPATVSISFDAGAGGAPNGKPACALPAAGSDHTFMVHELGHVLGFEHTFGVWNNGIDWDRAANGWVQSQEYGDPYDIMSSATFGQRVDPAMSRYQAQPAFAGPSPAGWPVGPQIGMGPAAALAHVDQWDKSALRTGVVRHLSWPTNSKLGARLYAAGRRQGAPRLLALHPPNEDAEGRGRCYVEYRDTSGWDAGLDVAGADLARQAVVVHTLADTPAAGVRCWYRGRILVPVEIDSDLAVTGTPLVVRVVDGDVAEGYVDVEISAGSARGIDLNTRGSDDIIHGNNLREMGTPCGDTIIYGDWITQTTYAYRAITYGFGGEGAPDANPPRLSWTLAGVPLAGGSGTTAVPTAAGTFTVDYALDPVTAELSLSSRGGERYECEVVVTAAEPDGSAPLTATARFAPLGYYSGFRPGDLNVLDRCMRKYMISVDLRPYELLIPPGPDPYRAQWRDQINMARVQEAINQMSPQVATQAAALGQIAAMRFGHLQR